MFLNRICKFLATAIAVPSLGLAGLNLASCARAQKVENGTQRVADWFIDATAQTGLHVTHANGMSGEFYYPEIIAPGVALLDYDNDGDLDVVLIQGGPLARTKDTSLAPVVQSVRLYRNDLDVGPDGTHVLRFTDVTEASGIHTSEYAMGMAVGDYDNDGCVDLFVTALGRNQLFRNNCNGTFTDVSRASHTDDTGWSVSAVFFDYDRDGWPDLFVGHYLRYSVDMNRRCFAVSGAADYCPPHI